MFSDIRLHRMGFILLINILLSEEDCKALHKEPFRNSCEMQGAVDARQSFLQVDRRTCPDGSSE